MFLLCIVEETKRKYIDTLKQFSNLIVLNDISCVNGININLFSFDKIQSMVTNRICNQIDVNEVNEWLAKNTKNIDTNIKNNDLEFLTNFLNTQIITLVVNIHDFDVKKNLGLELLLFVKQLKEKVNTEFKVVYFTSTHLLQTYINVHSTNKYEIVVPIIQFVSFIKKHISLTRDIKNALQKAKVSFITIKDFLYDHTSKSCQKFENFTHCKQVNKVKPSLLNHQSIRNWNQVFNLLSKTEFNEYLK